jgi:tetratricopeptide (TPR) repeat protein
MKRIAGLVLLLPALALATPARAAGSPDTRYSGDEALRHYIAGRWLEEVGDLSGAGAEFARALALDPDDETVLLRAAEVASKAGDPRRSLELARRTLTRHPEQARAHWLEGAALFNLERGEEALVALRAARDADSSDTEILRTLGRVAETLDRIELVDSCYARLVTLDEEDGESWFQLATTRARLGRLDEADSALTRALEVNPMRPGGLFLRGWIRERQGRDDDAILLYKHHLETHPTDQATRRRLVSLLGERGHVSEALAESRRVIEGEPKDAAAWQVHADLAYLAGRADEGDKAVARLVALDPGSPDGVARAATVLARRGRGAQAVKMVDAWARARPDELRAIEMRAWARSIAGEPDSAVTWARRAADSQPDSLPARRLLARYLREARRYPEAVVELQRLREAQPRDPSLLLDLGLCREQSGDVTGAIQAGRDALALAPDAPPVLNFLGYMLVDHERDLGEAEKLIHRAVDMDPDNGAYVDSMGWLHFRRGQLDKARSELERAIQLTGGDPVIHEHLGDVYAKLNLLELARREYRLSLDGDAGNRRVKGKLEAAH